MKLRSVHVRQSQRGRTGGKREKELLTDFVAGVNDGCWLITSREGGVGRDNRAVFLFRDDVGICFLKI